MCVPGWIGFRLMLCAVLVMAPFAATAAEDSYPRYKPSSRSPEPLDIRTNSYGASRAAPNALEIGDTAPEFTLPRVGGGSVSLSELHRSGETVIIFYRGHW